MSAELVFGLYIFVLAGFLGHHVISKVPALLHTPLMAGTNAISGISLVGSLVAAGAGYNQISTWLGFVAVTCATINTVGGFMITDRMLKMFKKSGSNEGELKNWRYLAWVVLALSVWVLSIRGVDFSSWIPLAYLIASACFILTLQLLSSPKHARLGNLLGSIGMLIAVVATLVHRDIHSYKWIVPGLIVGSLVGASMAAWIPMTKMPERIALSHCFGGLAAALVGVSEYVHHGGEIQRITMGALGLEVFLGFLTFTGSLMAFGKLQGLISGAPLTYRGQNYTNVVMFFGALVLLVLLIRDPSQAALFYSMGGLGLALGILFVLPIGGADMPVVISLLNSYAGLAAAATGFALGNYVLIIAGALDGTSGFLLSLKMSQAMNRSFANVLFGAFGTGDSASAAVGAGAVNATYNQATVEDAVQMLQASQQVIVVPGYGMAVSQAQHVVRELAQALEAKGVSVKYAIHPVAGRMPGHMNVLLAEANVPYDQLFDIDEINDEFARTDTVLVVGANDVVNPAAKTNPASPIFGMPVFNVEAARAVIVLKRSFNTGFSGIENDLFGKPNTMMVLGDAKHTLRELLSGVKA